MFIKLVLVSTSILILSGCASIKDAPRNILGFSRKDIIAARDDAMFQVYQAGQVEVFAVVEEIVKVEYVLFTRDEIRGFIMLMGIPGVVDTTEVGIFVTPLGFEKGVKVELSSRSLPAKKVVAALLFSKLGEKLNKI